MQGFKSFPDKTKITIENGVTAIIGPNGSGKSNISDAVRWVLGEMSLKSLRGSKMEDVIFNGTTSRQPSNYCSVSICFDTEEEFIANQNMTMDFDSPAEEDDGKKKAVDTKIRLSDNKETTITRKYYRSGESEYYINKTQVRLKDIYELLYDTGIGREGYSVIGQGKISEVLSQKGDERRSIFEEAAGISKFRYKKTEAERKLKETEQNLIRINDILSEVSSRIGPLEKEAENAKQYLILSEEKKGLEITLWLDKIDEIRSELEKSSVEFSAARYELEQCEEKVTSLETSLDNIINENYEISRELSETERLKSEAGQKGSGIEGKKAVLLNDIIHYNRTLEENEQARLSTEADIMSTTELLKNAKEASGQINKELEKASIKTEEIQSEYDKIHTTYTLLQKQLEAANADYSALFEKNAGVMSTGARIDTSLELALNSKENAEEEINTSKNRIAELQSELEKAAQDEQAAKSDYEGVQSIRSDTEKKIAALRIQIDKLKDEIVAKRLALAADEQKREHLTRLEQLFEGYSDSVRSVISDTKQGKIKANGKPIGLHGTVSSIISTEGDYVVALETALGAAVQFIVVDNEQDAKAAIEYLKVNRAGRATFLPLTTVRGRKCDVSEVKNIPGYIGIASELAKFDKKYEGIIDDLLGRTIIATNIDAAIKIANKTGYKIKIVTCDGQVINAGGSFTGGSSAKKVGLLTRSVDIERLSEEIKKKNASLLESERASYHLQKQIAEAEEQTSQSAQHIEEKKAALDNAVAIKNTVSVRLEEEKKRLEALTTGKSESEKKLEDLKKQKEDYLASVKEDSEKLAASKELLASIKEKAEAARSEEESVYEKLTTARISLLEKKAYADRQNEQVKQLNERIESYKQRLNDLKAADEKARNDIAECEKQITLLDNEINNVSEEIKVFDEKMLALMQRREKKEKETNEIRQSVKQAQNDKEEAFKRFTALEARQTKLNSDYDDITAKLWDEYELTYSAALPYRLPEEQMQKAPSRLATLKNKIRAMGSINVNAVEEYRQEKERFDFLTAQTDDLNKTRRSLDSAITKLNTEMKETFLACFDKINKAFGEVFVKLFGGGSAHIELTDPEQPLECGIDIILKPPGKSVKSISLLSGGEQSFAAVALYLALQKINPAPFCIFDEIESALDDINVAKLAEYVKSNSDKTQYIMITHRRGTMERADTLYGVTMRQKGISEYIKLNVSKLEEHIKEYTN
jgi:chromosome segregation protein